MGADKPFSTIVAKQVQKENVKKFNAKRTPEEYKKRVERLVAREEKRRKDIEKAGIKYSFPGYVSESRFWLYLLIPTCALSLLGW